MDNFFNEKTNLFFLAKEKFGNEKYIERIFKNNPGLAFRVKLGGVLKNGEKLDLS